MSETEVYEILVYALDMLAQQEPRQLIIQSYGSTYLDVSSLDGRYHFRLTAEAKSTNPKEEEDLEAPKG